MSAAVRTVPDIIWVPVNDITTFELHERIRVVDIRGREFHGFVSVEAWRLDSGEHALVVAPDSKGGGVTHSTPYDSFYREIGWK